MGRRVRRRSFLNSCKAEARVPPAWDYLSRHSAAMWTVVGMAVVRPERSALRAFRRF